MIPENQEWIFTFGCGQEYPNGFVAITARNADEAKAEMVRRHGLGWCWQYNSREEAGVEKFNLREVK